MDTELFVYVAGHRHLSEVAVSGAADDPSPQSPLRLSRQCDIEFPAVPGTPKPLRRPYSRDELVNDIKVVGEDLAALSPYDMSPYRIGLVNLAAMKFVGYLAGHKDGVWRLTRLGSELDIDRDGPHLASASRDKTVRLWDVKQLQEVAQIHHTAQCYSVFSIPWRHWLCSGGNAPYHLYCHDLVTLKETCVLKGHSSYPHAYDTMEKLRLVVTGQHYGSNEARVFDLRTDTKEAPVLHTTRHPALFNAILCNEETQSFYCLVAGGNVHVWDLRNMSERRMIFHAHPKATASSYFGHIERVSEGTCVSVTREATENPLSLWTLEGKVLSTMSVKGRSVCRRVPYGFDSMGFRAMEEAERLKYVMDEVLQQGSSGVLVRGLGRVPRAWVMQ